MSDLEQLIFCSDITAVQANEINQLLVIYIHCDKPIQTLIVYICPYTEHAHHKIFKQNLPG